MKIKNLIFALALGAIAQVAIGQVHTISGTAHDMSGETWNTAATNQLCGTCHVPHNALVIAQAPLWSHTTSIAAYSMYTSAVSSTFDATPGVSPDGNSKLCLSCHDGTVALDNFIGGANLSGHINDEYPGTTAFVGTDLSNDHPISFIYDAALVTLDGGLNPVTDPSNLPGGGTIHDDLLFADKMQCASCHNPHDDFYGSFQRMNNDNSELCLTCHNK